MELPFQDRAEAGRVLSEKLRDYKGSSAAILLALPRGGVPVGFEVARQLGIPLDIFIVRKLGVPGQEELAFGAVASGGVRVLNDEVVRAVGLPQYMIDKIASIEEHELARRELAYRSGAEATHLGGRVAILVDDGLATGATMLAAVRAVRAKNPARVVVAVPVASRAACRDFEAEVDQVVCAFTPEPFRAVGLWYQDFSQTTDDEVRELLACSAHAAKRGGADG